jgi:hypothetical protein
MTSTSTACRAAPSRRFSAQALPCKHRFIFTLSRSMGSISFPRMTASRRAFWLHQRSRVPIRRASPGAPARRSWRC